jgi:hypothetical protein
MLGILGDDHGMSRAFHRDQGIPTAMAVLADEGRVAGHCKKPSCRLDSPEGFSVQIHARHRLQRVCQPSQLGLSIPNEGWQAAGGCFATPPHHEFMNDHSIALNHGRIQRLVTPDVVHDGCETGILHPLPTPSDPTPELSRNDAVGSVVLAGSSFARASSFARYGPGTGPRLAHSSSCERICGATTSLPTASFRLSAKALQLLAWLNGKASLLEGRLKVIKCTKPCVHLIVPEDPLA